MCPPAGGKGHGTHEDDPPENPEIPESEDAPPAPHAPHAPHRTATTSAHVAATYVAPAGVRGDSSRWRRHRRDARPHVRPRSGPGPAGETGEQDDRPVPPGGPQDDTGS